MGIHQKVFGYCRMLSRRFPYAIYYSHSGDVARVFRVLARRVVRPVGLACLGMYLGGKLITFPEQ
jgi:hypothetical protein